MDYSATAIAWLLLGLSGAAASAAPAGLSLHRDRLPPGVLHTANACLECQNACSEAAESCMANGGNAELCWQNTYGDCKLACKGSSVCGGSSASSDDDDEDHSGSAGSGGSLWNHNGSTMRLVASGSGRRFVYVNPRQVIRRMGANPGTLLFDGSRNGSSYHGTARIFRGSCGVFEYEVSGNVSNNDKRVTLYGQAPEVGDDCRIRGYKDDVLVFEYIRVE